MTHIEGVRGSATLDPESLTLRTKKTEVALPLEAIAAIEHVAPRGMRAGYVRAVLVASWTAPRRPFDDANTIEYVARPAEWSAFVDELEQAVAAAVPKRSLPIFSHHAGSGWPDGVQEPPAGGALHSPSRQASTPAVAQAKADFGEMAGVRFGGSTVSYKGERQPLRGARATVESAGEITSRMSGVNVVGGAMLFGATGAIVGALARKKVDQRELYLTVEGDSHVWTVAISPKKGAAARAFAAKLNGAAKRST